MKNDDHHALAFDLIPQVDHDALIRTICQSARKKGAVKVDVYAWRYLLCAVYRHDRRRLDEPLERRLTEETLGYLVVDLQQRLKPVDVISTLRNLLGCARRIMPDADWRFEFVRSKIRELTAIARRDGTLVRPGRVIKAVAWADMPERYRRLHDDVKAAHPGEPKIDAYGKEFTRFVGALDRAGVAWRGVDPQDLITAENLKIYEASIHNFEEPWLDAKRLTTFGCSLKHFFPDLNYKFVRTRAAALRRLRPGSLPYDEDRESIPWERVPLEDRDRLEFALRTNHFKKSHVSSTGKTIALPSLPAEADSVDTLRLTLRSLHTALLQSAADISRQPVEDRDLRTVATIYEAYFTQTCIPRTVATRLYNLVGVLKRIRPDVNLRFIIRRARALKLSDPYGPVVVPAIKPEEIKATALKIMEQSYRRMKDLLACRHPYRKPRELAEAFRNALIIAILAEIPLRLRTLSMLLDGETIKKAHRDYVLDVPKKLMKKKKAYFGNLPPDLTEWIDKFRAEVRAVIAPKSKSKHFWISRRGGRLSKSAFQQAVPALILAHHGIWLNVHKFRHVQATARIGEDDRSASRSVQHGSPKSIKKYKATLLAQQVSRRSSLKDEAKRIFGPKPMAEVKRSQLRKARR